MKYEGPLFGRQGRRLIPLKLTSEDVDRMEEDLAEARALLSLALNYLDGSAPGVTSGGIRNERLRRMIEKHVRPWKWENGAGSHDMSQCPKMIETGSKLMDEFLAREIEKIGETKKLPEWVGL